MNMTDMSITDAYQVLMQLDKEVQEETEIAILSGYLKQFAGLEKMLRVANQSMPKTNPTVKRILEIQNRIKTSMLAITEKIYSLIDLNLIIQ